MSGQNIPLIFVHNGNKYYLKPVLEQAYAFNRDVPIYLLGDETNDKYKFANHYLASDYFGLASQFESVYQHMSVNAYGYELFCFQRWFIVNEFVKQKGIKHFLCLDSDVLLFCNVSKVFSEYINYDFTICETHCPCYTLFSSETLDKFCTFLMDMYTNSFYLNILKKRYEDILARNEKSGISDMTAFRLYQDHISSNVKELTDIENGECFDGNINDYTGFEKDDDDRKKVYWEESRPYLVQQATDKHVYVKGLHFQGNSKVDIYKYLVDKNTNRGMLFRIRTLLSIPYIRSRRRKRRLQKRANR